MHKIVKWRCYIAIPLRSSLWRPGTNFKLEISRLISKVASNGDYVVVSEKALTTALGLLYDEENVKPDLYSKIMTYMLVKVLWGKLLSRICKLSEETRYLLEHYPLDYGSRHKKLVLRLGGILQALKPTSEAGVDTTNIPKTLVSLPLPNPFQVAQEIRDHLAKTLGLNINVVIVDSDKCYKLKGLSLIMTCRKTLLPCSLNLGFLSFLIARMFKKHFSPYATPIGFSPRNLDVNELLIVSELADRARGYGAGRTLYEVEKTFGVKASEVTWDILNSIPHYPVVVVKKIKRRVKALQRL